MPFVKGNPGKPKGTKHRVTRTIQDTAARLNCDPFEVLCLFTNGDWKALGYESECYFAEKPDGAVKMGYTITPDMRLVAAKEASKYLYSQRRAVDITSNDATVLNDEELAKKYVVEIQRLKELK